MQSLAYIRAVRKANTPTGPLVPWPKPVKEDSAWVTATPCPRRDTPVHELGLSRRIVDILRDYAECATVEDVVSFSRDEMLSWPGIGPTSVGRIGRAIGGWPIHRPVRMDLAVKVTRALSDAELRYAAVKRRLVPGSVRERRDRKSVV